MDDKWIKKLSDGRKIIYKCKTLLSGRIKISAQVVDADIDRSQIIERPVKRKDVEMILSKKLA